MSNAIRNMLIIGATSGIGRELCAQYARRGCKVTATGRRRELLASLKESSANISTCAADVVDCHAAALLQKALAAGGVGYEAAARIYLQANLKTYSV